MVQCETFSGQIAFHFDAEAVSVAALGTSSETRNGRANGISAPLASRRSPAIQG
jgi:hypothetical protein